LLDSLLQEISKWHLVSDQPLSLLREGLGVLALLLPSLVLGLELQHLNQALGLEGLGQLHNLQLGLEHQQQAILGLEGLVQQLLNLPLGLEVLAPKQHSLQQGLGDLEQQLQQLSLQQVLEDSEQQQRLRNLTRDLEVLALILRNQARDLEGLEQQPHSQVLGLEGLVRPVSQVQGLVDLEELQLKQGQGLEHLEQVLPTNLLDLAQLLVQVLALGLVPLMH